MSYPSSPFLDGRDVELPLEDLLTQVAAGMREAFRKFYDRRSPRVLAMALAVLPDRVRAEKITEQVFVDVWWRATEFAHSTGSADSWVSTLTRARIIDELRHSRPRKPTRAASRPRPALTPAGGSRCRHAA